MNNKDPTIECILIKLVPHIVHGERMISIDFQGQGSKVKVTEDNYGNNLVNTIETEPISVF